MPQDTCTSSMIREPLHSLVHNSANELIEISFLRRLQGHVQERLCVRARVSPSIKDRSSVVADHRKRSQYGCLRMSGTRCEWLFEHSARGGGRAEQRQYKVTFCPGGRGAGVNPPLANAAVSQKPGNSAGIDGGSDNYIHVQAPITETWTGTGGPVPATPTASSGASQPTGQSKSATTSHVTTRSDSAQKPFTTPHASSSSISGGSGAASSSSSRGSHPTASPTGGHECKRKRKRRYE